MYINNVYAEFVGWVMTCFHTKFQACSFSGASGLVKAIKPKPDVTWEFYILN